MPKILMIAPEPFFTPRGTPISVYQRLVGLASLGYRIDLLTYHVGQDVVIPGVKIHRIPPIPFVKQVKIGPSWPKLWLDILLITKAILMLASNRYDVIHSHEEAAFFSMVLASIFGPAHLYDMHSTLPKQLENFNYGNYWPLVKLFEMLERWVLKTCDAVITVGADLETHVTQINPRVKQVKIENLAVHPNGSMVYQGSIDGLKERLGLNGKVPIVYTGTFERYQGLDLLLESAAIVRERHPKVLFVLVGGTHKQVKYWQNVARQNNLGDCTVFVGTVSLDEALAYLEVAEILVSPRTEGTSVPLKIYSYLHSGKPMVATNLIAHSQVLNEDVAILVEPVKEAFAAGILRLIREPDLRKQMGLQAQRLAQTHYNQDQYLAKLKQVYQLLLPGDDMAVQPIASSGNVDNRNN